MRTYVSLMFLSCLSLTILNCSNRVDESKVYKTASVLNEARSPIKKTFNCSGTKISLIINYQKDDIEAPYFGKASVLIDNKEIYKDEEIYEYLDSIKLIPYKDNVFIFCQYRDRPDPNFWHVIQLKQFKFKKDTLIQTGIGIDFLDVDNDGLVEFGGLLSYNESYCLSCDSLFYISNRIYEISDSIKLDSVLSKAENIKEYGYHIDFSIGKHVIPKREH